MANLGLQKSYVIGMASKIAIMEDDLFESAKWSVSSASSAQVPDCPVAWMAECPPIALSVLSFQAWGLQLYLERDSGTIVFLWNLRIFKEKLFYKCAHTKSKIKSLEKSFLFSQCQNLFELALWFLLKTRFL